MVHFAELFTVARHEYGDCSWGVGKMEQGAVHCLLQVGERREMFEMCRLLLHLLPQGLNRVAVWRVGRQRCDGEAIGVGLAKRLHGLAGMITRPVLHPHDRRCGLRQDLEPKGRRARRVEATGMRLIEESSGERVHEPKDRVRLPCAAGGHRRLLACGRPRVAPRAPRGNTGLIAQEPQGPSLLGLAQHLGPPALAPLEALGCVEMSRDQAGFLRRKAHILEQCRDGVRRRRHPTVALHEVLHPRRMPASGRLACLLWTRFDPLGQRLSLGLRQLTRSPGRGFVYQAGHALTKGRMAVITPSLLTERKHLRSVADALALSPGKEDMEALAHVQRAAGVGLLETAREWLAAE